MPAISYHPVVSLDMAWASLLSEGFCLPGISFCSFVSFSVHSFPTLPEQIWLWGGRTAEFPCPGSFSFSSKDLFLCPYLTPEVGTPFFNSLAPACGHCCGAHEEITVDDFHLYLMSQYNSSLELLSCASHNQFLLGYTLLLQQSVPGKNKFRGLF